MPALHRHRSAAAPPGLGRRWIRRIDGWGREHRRRVWWLLMIAIAVAAVWALPGAWRVAANWLRDPTGSQRRNLALPPEIAAEPPPVEASHNHYQPDPEAPGQEDQTPPPAVAVPEFDWRAPGRVRQAAAVLAANGHLDEALALLLVNDHAPAELRDIGRAAYAKVDDQLNQLLPAELDPLRDYWAKLPDDQRQALYPPGAPARTAALTNFLAAPVDTSPASWRQLGEALPPSLAFTLARNLHVQALAATELPSELVQIVISMRLQLPLSVLNALPPIPTTAPTSAYADNLQAYAAAIDDLVLPRIFDSMVLAEKQRLLTMQGETLAWFKTIWGDPFTRMADLYPSDGATADQTRRLFEALPIASQVFWAQRALIVLADEHVYLPATVIAASSWLKQTATPLNKAAVLYVIRRHPRWQKALQGFNYDAALKEIPSILDDLSATGYATTLKVSLAEPLRRERRTFEQTIFRWDVLADAAGVEQEIPDSLAGQVKPRRGADSFQVYTYKLWSDIDQETVYKNMLAILAKPPRSIRDLKPFYRQAFALYALNRGLIRDERENTQPPPLVPDPLQPIQPPAPVTPQP